MDSNTLLVVTVSKKADFSSVKSTLEGFGLDVEEVGVCSWEVIEKGNRFVCTGGRVSWSEVVDAFRDNSSVVVSQWPKKQGNPYTEDLSTFRKKSVNNKWRNKLS